MTLETERPVHTQLWGALMTVGILLAIGGTFALFAAVLTSIVTVVFIGVLLVIAGILEVVSAFRHSHRRRFLAYVLAGLLAIVVGALLLLHPVVGLASLALLIAGYLFASGLFRGITAISERYPHWGWDLAYGAAAVALGFYILASWPVSAFWVLGTVVAAEIIVRGISLIAASSAVRDIEHHRLPGHHAAA